MKQVEAVNVRIELDLRIGASFTRFQTLNFQKLFSDLSKKVISFGKHIRNIKQYCKINDSLIIIIIIIFIIIIIILNFII